MIPLSGRGGRGFDSLMSPIYFLVFGARVQGARRPPTRPVKRVPTRRERAFTTRRSPTVSSGARAVGGEGATSLQYQYVAFYPQKKLLFPKKSSGPPSHSSRPRRPRRAISLSINPSHSAGAGAARASSSPSSVWAAAAPRGPRLLSEHPRRRPHPPPRRHPSTQPRQPPGRLEPPPGRLEPPPGRLEPPGR